MANEGIKLVKSAKLQMLISRFEEIKMLGDETFREFYTKMSDLRNSMVSLEKFVLDVKLIQKIIRSLPKRFRTKVTTIEESNDLEEMKIEELVGSLQTYKLSLPPVKKVKTIALKASKEKARVSSEEDSDNEEDVVAMLAKNFERLMKNDKFKKKFFERLKKAPKESKTEEAEKKDPRGKGKAYNVTLSDESEEETPAQDQFIAFVAPHEDQEDSQSYYFEYSDEDGEELKEAYKILYVEFEKLRETRKQHIHELNSLQTDKSSLLLKIQDLEEKLLETQLQLERVTDEKLTHMLSIQKSPTDKIGLGYVVSSSDISSTSRTVFVKRTIPEPPSIDLDKEKEFIDGDVPASAKATQKPHIIRRPHICHHYGLSGHIRPQCSLLKAQRSKVKKELPLQATFGTRPLAQY